MTDEKTREILKYLVEKDYDESTKLEFLPPCVVGQLTLYLRSHMYTNIKITFGAKMLRGILLYFEDNEEYETCHLIVTMTDVNREYYNEKLPTQPILH